MFRAVPAVILVLVGILSSGTIGHAQACAGEKTPPTPQVGRESKSVQREFENFGGYLAYMSKVLDFHYTIEQIDSAPEDSVSVLRIRKFDRAIDSDTVDQFVARCNASMQEVTLRKSESNPHIVHVVARDLPADDNPLDCRISIDAFRGTLVELVEAVGSRTEGKIVACQGIGFPLLDRGDITTRVQITADNERVRDILSRAVPERGYEHLAWTASRNAKEAVTEIKYHGFEPSNEERILVEEGTIGYLREMGGRLDCYFTIEDDRRTANPAPWIVYERTFYNPDFKVDGVDGLVASLDRAFNTRSNPVSGEAPTIREERVRVVKNDENPRVIHIVRTSLLSGAYAMNEQVDFQHWDKLSLVPHSIGEKLGGRVNLFGQVQIPYVRTGALPYVSVSLNSTVRDALTLASPLDDQRRVLWGAATYTEGGKDKTKVVYEGVSDEIADLLGYDQGKLPTAP